MLFEGEFVYQVGFFVLDDYVVLLVGLCYCDLFCDNVLFVYVVFGIGYDVCFGGFFDFYFVGCDKWLFDVVVIVNDWCVDFVIGVFDVVCVDVLLCVYQIVWLFMVEECCYWSDMLCVGVYCFWVLCLYDFYLLCVVEMFKLYDFGYFECILCECIVYMFVLFEI